MGAFDDPLWQAIGQFSIDEGEPAFTFAARLARENGWTLQWSQRVIEEYKRFIYLAMAAGHPVTPSDEVDQAWHLHLTYTRSYWERLCGQVLPRPLHHGPTRGGEAESAKFHAWYSDTLASYARLFGEAPPADVWPPAFERFAPARFERVDRRRYWLLPRPRIRRAVACGIIPAAGVMLPGAWLLGLMDSPFVWLLVIAAGIMVVIRVIRGVNMGRRRGGKRGNGGGWWGGGCGAGGCGAGGGGDGCGASGCGGGSCGGGCGGS